MNSQALPIQVINRYLSIKKIDIDTKMLPQITVITGINGVGKTHFLDGITRGDIEVIINNQHIYKTDIVKPDLTNINSSKTNNKILHPDTHHGENIITAFVSTRNSCKQTIFEEIENKIKNGSFNEVIDASKNEEISLPFALENIRTTDPISFLLDAMKEQINDQMTMLGIGNLIPPLRELSEKNPYLFWYGDKYQIYNSPFLDKAAETPFSDLTTYLFQRENERYQSYMVEYQVAKNNNTPLPEAQKEYFWDTINNLFSEYHFDFEFRAELPCHNEIQDHYNTLLRESLTSKFLEDGTPKMPSIKNFGLFQKSTGIKIEEKDLSSGERIIFSLLKIIFNANNYTPSNNYPKLVLLDEIDAHLHPQNCQYAFNFIKILASKYNINFIITTHTASTVALFDDVNIYEFEKPTNISDAHRLKKITKNEAVYNLTSGVPTLSFDISGNKYVFVESEHDVYRYTHIYDALIENKILPLFPKLLFINIGVKGENCEAVKSLISKIKNKSVCGLIDGDDKNLDDEYKGKRIFQLSPTKRYAIENLILDPVFVICTLQEKNKLSDFSITDFPTNPLDLNTVTQEQWQTATNIIMEKLGFDMTDTIDIEYLNDAKITVPQKYLLDPPHSTLEDIYKKKMPIIFNSLIANPTQNNNTILKDVLSCVSHHTIKMIPKDLIDTFLGIISNSG